MLFNSLPSFASDTSSAFTTEQEKRIGEIAADYMRAHPDILIQMSETLQQEQQEKQTRGLKSAALAQQARIMADKRIPPGEQKADRSWWSSSLIISVSGAVGWRLSWRRS